MDSLNIQIKIVDDFIKDPHAAELLAAHYDNSNVQNRQALAHALIGKLVTLYWMGSLKDGND